MSGIRAEIKIYVPAACPVVGMANATGGSATSISKVENGSETVTEEFVLENGDAPDPHEVDGVKGNLESVFSYGDKQAFRFERSASSDCICEVIEDRGHPLRNVHAEDNELVVVFHTPDIDTLQEVLTSVREKWPTASVNRLIQSSQESSEEDLVFVDTRKLTDRQQEVLETAHDMGYFDHPKRANAGEVAHSLDISQSTFTEHLAAAQRKLLENILEA